MPFLSDRTIHEIGPSVIHPFHSECVRTGMYELSLHLDSRASGDGHTLDENFLKIPPGQFAYLFTKERVTIPNDLLGFISLKSSKKWKGLINISGFHVDPGYSGRLKFAVYNAGSRNIFLEFSAPTFQLWLASFDHPATPYSKPGCDGITSEDLSELSGDVHTPATLDRRITSLEQWNRMFKYILTTIGVVAAIISIFPTIRGWISSLGSGDTQKQAVSQRAPNSLAPCSSGTEGAPSQAQAIPATTLSGSAVPQTPQKQASDASWRALTP